MIQYHKLNLAKEKKQLKLPRSSLSGRDVSGIRRRLTAAVPLYTADATSTKTGVVVWLAENSRQVGVESVR